MALHDPFAAYNAGSNLEAHLVCHLLIEAGIEAVVIEDVSQVGVWLGGTISEIHKPQVWIERENIERARPVLTEYDRRSAQRRLAKGTPTADGNPISVICEKCGQQADFPKAQNGTVQICPHCRAYVDVGDDPGIEGWEDDSVEPA
jgi:hypothetical protein